MVWHLTVRTGDNDPRDRPYVSALSIDGRECSIFRKTESVRLTNEEFAVFLTLDFNVDLVECGPDGQDDESLGFLTFAQLSAEQQKIVAFAHHFGAVYWWSDDSKLETIDSIGASRKKHAKIYAEAWMQKAHAELMANTRMAYYTINICLQD